jgi:uncharacterized protein YciI
MSEMPARPAIDQVWVVEATYAPDATDTRVPFRAEHLGRIVRLMDEGVIVMAGAYLDVSTSLVFLSAVSEEEALAIARQDPYIREGVWVELRARPFGRVVRREPEAAAGS